MIYYIFAVFFGFFSPFIKLTFPGIDPKGPAARAISMNMAANLLGPGNTANPRDILSAILIASVVALAGAYGELSDGILFTPLSES